MNATDYKVQVLIEKLQALEQRVEELEQRKWVGLTSRDRIEIVESVCLDVHETVYRTEAILKERNK